MAKRRHGRVIVCLLGISGVGVNRESLDIAAYNNRGVAFRSNGEIDRAIEDYDQAIPLKPDYYVAINNRGVAFMNKGALDRAFADFDRTNS